MHFYHTAYKHISMYFYHQTKALVRLILEIWRYMSFLSKSSAHFYVATLVDLYSLNLTRLCISSAYLEAIAQYPSGLWSGFPTAAVPVQGPHNRNRHKHRDRGCRLLHQVACRMAVPIQEDVGRDCRLLRQLVCWLTVPTPQEIDLCIFARDGESVWSEISYIQSA